MKVVSIVGARPQFIKAAPVSRELRRSHEEILVHTGQHYDENMSAVFFENLRLPQPAYNLGVGSGSHSKQTGEMLIRLEEVLLAEQPDWALVYGDTNSTLAGALTAAKLHISVAHVEAGLRSFNRAMPEEVNRILTDHLSDVLFCPSQTARDNLTAEGITRGVYIVGDVMADALSLAIESVQRCSDVLTRLGLTKRTYLLATVHRAENTDNPDRLRNILSAFAQIDEPIVFPVHPRTRKILEHLARDIHLSNVRRIEPVSYVDMVILEQSARLILTDSGGIQKEAYWLGTPCVTLRDETEWVETVQFGWNMLTGADPQRIVAAVRMLAPPANRPPLYGEGQAAAMIVNILDTQPCSSIVDKTGAQR